MKLTKTKIEELANEIIDFLKKNDLENDVCIYFNNKRIRFYSSWDCEHDCFILNEKVEEDMNPLDYFEYANPKHILSMSFEGALYDVFNGYHSWCEQLEDKFDRILEKYDLYKECGNSWNLSCYPDTIEYEDIEYTQYEKEVKPDPIYIFSWSTDVPKELLVIKHMWDKLSNTTQHLGGSCVLGAGFEFTYKEIEYKMTSPNYQQSLIYEHWIDDIKEELNSIGATEIRYNYGHMD